MPLIDSLVYSLTALLISSILVSIFFRSPLERVINLIFDLQIILHLPILEVTLPGNVTTIFTKLLPLAQFDLLGSFTSEYFINSSISAESHLEYLGQRMVVGYDSYNFYRNIGSLYILLIIYLIKALILMIILKPLSYTKYKRAKRIYRSVYR